MAITKEETALATRASAQLANIDDMFDESAHEGLENVGSDEIILPRLAILQATSPLTREDGYKQGDLVNSLTGHNFGKKLEFFPLIFFVSRTNWVDNTVVGGPIDCQARDGEHGTKKDAAHAMGLCQSCVFSQWSDGEPPHCTQFKNVLLIPKVADATPMAFSAKRSAVKPTNLFLSAAAMLRRKDKPVPFYGSSWFIESELKQNDEGTFYVPRFTRGTLIEDPVAFMSLRSLYQEMKAAQSKIVVPQENDSTEAAPRDDAGDF